MPPRGHTGPMMGWLLAWSRRPRCVCVCACVCVQMVACYRSAVQTTIHAYVTISTHWKHDIHTIGYTTTAGEPPSSCGYKQYMTKDAYQSWTINVTDFTKIAFESRLLLVERGDWKCETWKYGTVKNAGVENARHEFAAPDCRGGKCGKS